MTEMRKNRIFFTMLLVATALVAPFAPAQADQFESWKEDVLDEHPNAQFLRIADDLGMYVFRRGEPVRINADERFTSPPTVWFSWWTANGVLETRVYVSTDYSARVLRIFHRSLTTPFVRGPRHISSRQVSGGVPRSYYAPPTQTGTFGEYDSGDFLTPGYYELLVMVRGENPEEWYGTLFGFSVEAFDYYAYFCDGEGSDVDMSIRLYSLIPLEKEVGIGGGVDDGPAFFALGVPLEPVPWDSYGGTATLTFPSYDLFDGQSGHLLVEMGGFSVRRNNFRFWNTPLPPCDSGRR